MKIDGACLCGAYAYDAEIDPAKVVVCHRTDCQISSASAFRFGVLVDKRDYRELRGTLKAFVKTAESGSLRALHFCPECGTSIYGCEPEGPTVYSLQLGTARQRAQLVPQVQVWRRSAATTRTARVSACSAVAVAARRDPGVACRQPLSSRCRLAPACLLSASV